MVGLLLLLAMALSLITNGIVVLVAPATRQKNFIFSRIKFPESQIMRNGYGQSWVTEACVARKSLVSAII